MRKTSLATTKGLLELVILNLMRDRSVAVEEMTSAFKKANFDVPMGTLYPSLLRMRRANYIEKALEEMDQGGLSYCFTITREGLLRVKQLKNELHKINSLLRQIKVD